MKSIKTKSPFGNLVIITCSLFLLLFILVLNGKSQGCLPPDTQPISRPHFRQGARVYYHFDSSIPQDSEQMNQIILAFENWNAANQLNCSRIEFWQGEPPIEFGYATLTLANAVIGSNYVTSGGGVAYFDAANGTIGNEVWDATIYFNPNLRISPSDLRRIYDPDQSTYNTFFTKEAMHEIGHGMGLNHYTRDHAPSCTQQYLASSPYNSVMNDACGFSDSENLMSTTVKMCDQDYLSSVYTCPTPTPTPTPTPPPDCQNAQAFTGNACPLGFTAVKLPQLIQFRLQFPA